MTLNGSEVAYSPGSLSLTSDVGARGVASISLVDTTGAVDYAALMGTEVSIVNDSDETVAFAGILTDCSWSLILGTTYVSWSLSFSDYSALADRVLIFDYYETATHPTTNDIVDSIITDYLADYGITAGTIEAGSAVSEVTFNGQRASEALNELAERDGYIWWVDDEKKLHYQQQGSYLAPWQITAALGNYIDMGGSHTLADYANRVYQRGPTTGISDIRTESQVGDGVRREFKLTYKAHSEVSITVNTVAATLGIGGIDSGKDFYWNQGDDIIVQDDAGTLLEVTDTLAVTYRGQVSQFIQMEDKADIATRAAAEATTNGVYEALFEDSSAIYLDLTIQAAETHLRQNPFDKVDLSYTTDEPGLRAGMLQHIVVPLRGIDDDFLLTSVSASELTNHDAEGQLSLRYSIGAVSGEKADDWIEYWRKLAGIKDFSLRDNEIVSICNKLAETVNITSVCSVSSAPSLQWNTNLWADGSAFW